jgi:hypothetical protein
MLEISSRINRTYGAIIMEYIKKIIEQYKDCCISSKREFSARSDECEHKCGNVCDHPEAIKKRWDGYSVDDRCGLDNCPL